MELELKVAAGFANLVFYQCKFETKQQLPLFCNNCSSNCLLTSTIKKGSPKKMLDLNPFSPYDKPPSCS